MSQVQNINMSSDAETALAYTTGVLAAIWSEGSFMISKIFGIMLISFGLAIYAAPTFAAVLTEHGWVNASPGTTPHNFLVWGFAVSSVWIVGTLKRLNWNNIIQRYTKIEMALKPDVTEVIIKDNKAVITDERKTS